MLGDGELASEYSSSLLDAMQIDTKLTGLGRIDVYIQCRHTPRTLVGYLLRYVPYRARERKE